MTAPVVVYGASGYTGKLIVWHLALAGIPFIAAGRSKARLEEQMAKVPELAGADYAIAEVEHDRASLATLFQGAKIVYNVTGPFMQLGEPVVQAALDAGCHYLDTTGETDWMAFCRDHYGALFAEKGCCWRPRRPTCGRPAILPPKSPSKRRASTPSTFSISRIQARAWHRPSRSCGCVPSRSISLSITKC
ncbi:saccharopine dehydrogenase NADP-binding domain-containing protein [Sphingopyxis sp. LK2115]|uniref:saccharopine dehydrogenase NADP-binding domain-containing protein n=1 Tax=Sphingopyxis sp. LK2115 TaxID=2744558 RepID=UPI002948BAA3|nr:saccharopine dehydrogenase NADP-binding domain-containing protein [Sphingopyxis sp. LK2115]